MTSNDAEPASTRLERALQLFLAHAESGGDAQRLLAEHADLRDLLEPLLAGEGNGDGDAKLRASGSTVRDGTTDGRASDTERSGHGAHDERAATGGDRGRVLGDFRLVRELGRGGMGIVWEAWQRSLDRPVALKLLPTALVANPSAVARFRREAAAVGRLRHPAIVEVHGFGSVGDEHFFAMGLVDGQPLTQCAARFHAPAAAVALVVQIVDALQHAHAHGLVHRDVKPGNVLVRADGSAVLTDFGLVHDDELPSVTTEGSFVGTLDYASPEQVQGRAVDARTDLWSIGVLLHELLTGQRPFARANATATMKAILTEDPPLLRRLVRDVPVDLAAIVDRALQKDPARRYASAAALLADLRAWQAGGVVSVRAPRTVERLLRWTRREPWRASTAAVLLLGTPLLTASLGYLWANAPRIAAATAAELGAVREAALTDAWLVMAEDADPRRERALAALRALPLAADDLEIPIAEAALLAQARHRDQAIARLQPLAAQPAVRHVLSILGDVAGDPTVEITTTHPTSAIEAFVLGTLAYDQVRANGRSPSLYTHAARHFATAVAMSNEPRAAFLYWWMIGAARAEDPAAVAVAFAAYELHFPDSPGLRKAAALCASAVPIERGLQLVSQLDLQAEPPLRFALAVLHFRAKHFADSEREYRAGLAADPTNAMAWMQLANMLGEQAHHAEAAEAARKWIELAPTNVSAFLRLGASLINSNDPAGARAAFTRAVELAPDQWRPHFNLGLMQMEAGEDEAALTSFLTASRNAPSQPDPLVRAIIVMHRRKQLQDELLTKARLLQVAQGDWDRWTTLTISLVALGWGATAIPYAAHATELAPQQDQAWTWLAEALLAAPTVDAPRALAAARRAEELAKGAEPRATWVLARAEAAAGDNAAAERRLVALLAQSKVSATVRKGAEVDLARLRAAR